MKNKIIIPIILGIFILLSGMSLATVFVPPGNMEGRGFYSIDNFTDITSNGNVTGVNAYFTNLFGNGAGITGISTDNNYTTAVSVIGTNNKQIRIAVLGRDNVTGNFTDISGGGGSFDYWDFNSTENSTTQRIINASVVSYESLDNNLTIGHTGLKLFFSIVSTWWDNTFSTHTQLEDNISAVNLHIEGNVTTPGGSDTQIQFNDGGVFNGTSGFVFNKSSGNVGINTENPTYTLDVVGNASFGTGADKVYITSSGRLSIGDESPAFDFTVRATGAQPVIELQTAGGVTTGQWGTKSTDNSLFFDAEVSGADIGFRTIGNIQRLIIHDTGKIGVGTDTTPDAQLAVDVSTSTNIGLIVQGAASQSANLQEWQNSSGDVLVVIDNDGRLRYDTTGSASDLDICWGTGSGNACDTGFYETTGNQIGVTQGGGLKWLFGSTGLSAVSNRGLFSNEAASLTNPVFIPVTGNSGSGIGGDATGKVSLVALSDSVLVVGPDSADEGVLITPSVSSNIGLTVQGVASQSANLQEWQDSSGTVLASVEADGLGNFPGGVQTGNIYNTDGTLAITLGNARIGWTPSIKTAAVYFAGSSGAAPSLIVSKAGLELGGSYQYAFGSTDDVQNNPNDAGIGRDSAGVVKITDSSTGFGSLSLGAYNLSTIALTVQGAASQSANLTEWQDSSGTTGLYVVNTSNDICIVGGNCLSSTSTTFVADSITLISGTNLTPANVSFITDLQDSLSYNVSENVGVNPLTIYINFTGVTGIDRLVHRYNYQGGLGHEIEVALWNYETNLWEEEFGDITDTNGFVTTTFFVYDGDEHFNSSDGSAALRYRHDQNGNSGHEFDIDYIALVKGVSASVTNEHDGLSGRDAVSNHPWAMDTSATRQFSADVNFGTNDVLNVTNVSAITDVCIVGGNCLSTVSGGGITMNDVYAQGFLTSDQAGNETDDVIYNSVNITGNVTTVECIVFASGGDWCSGS